MLKYFTENEFNRVGCSLVDMDKQLLFNLDLLRSLYGKPISINSAYRKPSDEILKGRSGKSLHCFGKAVDISCSDSFERFRLVSLAMDCGFTGIGIGKNFIHLDIREGNPLMFHYYL